MKNSLVTPNYSSVEVLHFTYECVQKIIDNNIQGCLIECGVATGNQLGAMQQCLVDNKVEKKIYGFDSFQGIPYAGENDKTQPGIGEVDKSKLDLLESSGITVHPKQHVTDNFAKWNLPLNNVELVEGWFQDTVPNYIGGKIALLRLDGDLYSSTLICLQYLLPKVVKGGIVIIDDWQLDGAKKAVLEYIPKKKIKEHLGIAYAII